VLSKDEGQPQESKKRQRTISYRENGALATKKLLQLEHRAEAGEKEEKWALPSLLKRKEKEGEGAEGGVFQRAGELRLRRGNGNFK